jgi:glycosyltransferase involved in cell wall biosynthesis
MKILYCNKYNYPFSGTEAYLFAAMELVRSQGHEAALFSMADPRGEPTPYDRFFVPHIDFKQSRGWLDKTRLAARAIYSQQARLRIRSMIAEFQPDVAHVRNLYHHLTPSILWELKAQNVPVLYHLNDFKVLCASYNLVSHGEVCEACKGGEFWHALQEKCYPGRGARLTLIAEAYFHRWIGTYRKCVDRFLAPSQFVRDKFVEHGWNPDKFEVLPHFQPVSPTPIRSAENAALLYFGRLSPEKGVDDLLRAMRSLPHLRLVVAGDGPDRKRLLRLRATLDLRNVEFVGHLSGAELQRAIADSSFTVLPSHAYETLGKTILESYAAGRAVVASDLGSRRELVQQGKTGLLYKTGDVAQLASAIRFLSSWPELADAMGRAGREQVRQRNAPQSHYEALIGLYERLATRKPRFSPAQKPSTLPSAKPATPAPTALASPRLRVAFIGGRGVASKYSGIETYYEEVGSRLTRMGHEVTAYCRSYFTPPGREHQGIKITRLPTIRSKHLETLIHTLLSTLHVLTQPCDLVHYHALGPALFSFVPRLAGKKTVVTVQGLDWQRRKWGPLAAFVLRLGERAAVTLPSATMVVSRTLQRHYRDAYGKETSYVPNGGMLRQRSAPALILEWDLRPQEYILFLGRFSPEKGCHLLIEAYEQLHTDIKLVMAGGSSFDDDYSLRLRSHASQKIKFPGWVAGAVLDELLTNAMLFVLPSDLEGLSLALLDAMGAGLCVLTTDLPENREALDGKGFTFRRGDATDLADRLRFLIANPAVRGAAGIAAKHHIRDQYRWSMIAGEIESVYFHAMGWKLPDAAQKKPPQSLASPAENMRRKAG